MCRKEQHRCPEALELRDDALQEWCKAETLEDVRRTWARLGGLTTLHRYGREHFAKLGRLSGEARRGFLTGMTGVATRAALVLLVAMGLSLGTRGCPPRPTPSVSARRPVWYVRATFRA